MVSIAGVSVFLQEWLLSHIAITDHAYVDQMNKHKGVIDLVSDNMRNDGSFSL